HRQNLSWLSMGYPAAGNGFFSNIPGPASIAARLASNCSTANAHPLAALVAAIPADVFIGYGQVAERRCDLAQAHRASVSLRNPTLANSAGLAGPSTASLVP